MQLVKPSVLQTDVAGFDSLVSYRSFQNTIKVIPSGYRKILGERAATSSTITEDKAGCGGKQL